MTKKQRKDEVIKVLNQMIQLCEPFAYADFNKLIPAKKGNNSKLIKAEKENSKIGYVYIKGNKKVYTKQKNVAITTLSLFATLTDILVDDRLSFIVEEDGTISGVSWYSECKK
jgi:ribosomal protein L39E